MKSREIAQEINVTIRSGKTVKKTVCEKQVVFWGRRYERGPRAEREEPVKKAMALVKNPQK